MSDAIQSTADSIIKPEKDMNFLSGKDKIRKFWDTLTTQPAVRKSIPMIFLTVGIAVVFIGFMILKQPHRIVLYPEVADGEKASIIATLEANGFNVQLDNAGQLRVAQAEYHRAKMLLAQNGLPKGVGSGYDVLNNLQVGASRSVEHLRLKQSIELELSRTISEIDGVHAARVHLAIPERTAFIRKRESANASVMLRLMPGRTLSDMQVRSIIHLVSASVPSLPVSGVAVVDQYGHLLSAREDDHDLLMTNKQLEYRTMLEDRYRERVISLLTPFVGVGNISSEVNVDVDFTRIETTQESFDKPGQIRSEQYSINSKADVPAEGVPGTLSNQPPTETSRKDNFTSQEAGISTQGSVSKSSVRNYEVGRQVIVQEDYTGKISRLTIAVVVKAPSLPSVEGAEGMEGAELRKLQEDNKIQAEKSNNDMAAQMAVLIKEAVGFSEERGDRVTVTVRPFIEQLTIASDNWYESEWVVPAIRFTAFIIVSVLLFVAFIQLLGVLKSVDKYAAGTDIDTLDVTNNEKAMSEEKKDRFDSAMLDDASSYDQKVSVLKIFIAEDHVRATNVLRQWMEEDIENDRK